MILRWGNTPFPHKIKTFPHHKHEWRRVVESKEMTVGRVFR
ncbi:MAG: toxin-antitoxin system TumE family protein [Nitrososphaerales archaeon]